MSLPGALHQYSHITAQCTHDAFPCCLRTHSAEPEAVLTLLLLLQDKYGFKAEEFHAGEVNCIF